MQKNNKKIRILALTPTYYPMMGGAERTVFELFDRLEKTGKYEIDLVTPNLGGKDVEKSGNYTIYRVGNKCKSKYTKFIMYQKWQYKKAVELLKKKKYDFLHIDFAFPAAFVVLKLISKYNLPLVTTEFHLGSGMDIIHENQNPFYVYPVIRKVYDKSDMILTISHEQTDFVKKNSSNRNIHTIHQGTDHKYFKPENYNSNLKKKFSCKGPILITVSRLSKRKCIDEMIEAVKIVSKKFKNVKLLIVGKGEEKENLQNKIEELGLQDNVIFTGFISDDDLRDLYATADIFLLTSKYEGFGIANCEALSSGTPVITYDTTAASDYIKDGITGFITNHDVKEFASKINYLLARPDKLKSFSKESRKLIEEGFTWERYAKEHDKILMNRYGKKK